MGGSVVVEPLNHPKLFARVVEAYGMLLTAWMLCLIGVTDPLAVVEPAVNAGQVYAGQALKHEFTVRNVGKDTLSISDLRASCGCAAPTIDRRVLQPGESAQITLEINTLSQPAGPIRWTATVCWHAGATTGQTTLELTAQLIREIELQPAALALVAQPGFHHDIVLTDRRPKPLNIRAVHTNTDNLRAEFLQGNTGESQIVRIRVSDNCPVGMTAETLRIATDDPKYPELRVPITVTCKPVARVTVVPERPTVTPDGSVLIQLRSRDGKAIVIDRVESSNVALTMRETAGPGNFATVRIRLDKAKWDREIASAEVKVLLRSPNGETVTIPVHIRPED
jgi:uncharacterized protein DUF1573